MIFLDFFLAQNFKTKVLNAQKKSTFRMSEPTYIEGHDANLCKKTHKKKHLIPSIPC